MGRVKQPERHKFGHWNNPVTKESTIIALPPIIIKTFRLLFMFTKAGMERSAMTDAL